MTAVMILYFVVRQGDDITPYSHVFRLHLIANACCLKRAAAFINLVKIISQDGCICHLTTRTVAVGNCYQSATTTFFCQHVHIWSVSILKKGFPSKFLHCMVCHAITKNNYMFHKNDITCWLIDIMLANTPAAVTPAPAP